jgi:hypothetical protein
MRAFTLGLVAATALTTTAVAQTDFEAQHHMLQQRSAGFVRKGSALDTMTKASKEWIAEQTKQQTLHPLPIDKLAVLIDYYLHADEVTVARAHHLDTADIVRAVTLQITRDAETAAKAALDQAQKAGDPAAIEAAQQNLALAASNRKAAMGVQNDASLELAGL